MMSDLATHDGLDTGQYLSFHLADEEYAVNILDVQEIKGWQPVTRIPNAPPHVLGVINLRGIVVPVMDLRSRFGLERRPFTPATVVIVVHVAHAGGVRTVGLVVDAVNTVYDLSPEVVREAPELGAGIEPEFLLGLATLDERMIVLLDIPALVNVGLLGDTAHLADVADNDAPPANAAARAVA